MKHSGKLPLCIVLVFVLLLGSVSAGAVERLDQAATPEHLALAESERQEQSGTAGQATLLLQLGSSKISFNGAVDTLGTVQDSPLMPQYASNGAILVPLQALADRLGVTLVWNEAKTQATVSDAQISLRFVQGSWNYQVNADSRVTPSPCGDAGRSFLCTAGGIERADWTIYPHLWLL